MFEDDKVNEKAFESDKALDLETALYFVRLIEANPGIRISGIIELANEALKKMSNPFAIKMLRDKINEE